MVEAQVQLVEGMQFVATSGTGHAIVVDGDPSVGGKNTGPRPMELILMGLAGCTAMDVVFILRRQRQPVQGLTVHVRGERAESHPKVYTRIHVEYTIYGDVDEKAAQRAIELSEEKYCSVSAMLKHTADITWSYRIVRADTSAAP